VNSVMKSRSTTATLLVAFVLAGALAANALASGSTPQGMSPQAFQALHARSVALDKAYGLGAGTGTPLQALKVRSEALNRAYGLGTVTPSDVAGALNALQVRSTALDARYHLGPYAVVRPTTGFNWGDAGIGAAGMFGMVLIGAGLIAGTRRYRTVRETSVPRTT
jgi:hypothetical protein